MVTLVVVPVAVNQGKRIAEGREGKTAGRRMPAIVSNKPRDEIAQLSFYVTDWSTSGLW